MGFRDIATLHVCWFVTGEMFVAVAAIAFPFALDSLTLGTVPQLNFALVLVR